MDLLEYQGKQLFARHGVPVPSGAPATTVEEAVAAADEIGYPCVVKAQVQIGGRGKAGGIKVAKDRAEAEEHSKAILGMDIRGPHGPRGVDRGRVGHRRRVLRVDRLRPLRQAPAGDALHAGRHGHRGGRREQPGRDRPPARRPAARLPGLPRAPARVRGRRRRRRRAPDRRAADQALRRVRQRRGDARRGQPADRHAATARSRRSTRRSRSTTTRSSATPTTPRCATSRPRTRRSGWRASAA